MLHDDAGRPWNRWLQDHSQKRRVTGPQAALYDGEVKRADLCLHSLSICLACKLP